MHDLVCDFVLSNFSKVKQASIVNYDNNVFEQLREEESYERILLKCRGMFEFPTDFNYPTLALLKLMDRDKLLKFPDDFYTQMEKLTVVTYENMHRPLLPQYSNNLRTLSFRSCSLVVMIYLHSGMLSTWKYSVLSIVASIIGCLLERNKLRWSYCCEYSFKNTLKLVISRAELLECKIHELFRKIEILYLEVSDMKHLEDISTLPPLNSFVGLKQLFISNCTGLTCLFTIPVAKGLRKLERLVISWCPVLKEIWSCEIMSGEVEVNSILMLRKIEVTYCNSLVNLFPNNPMQFMSHLEELVVRGCGSIEVLFNIDLGKIEQLSTSYSSLRSIIVFNLENLRHVWRIKDVENKYCDGLIRCFQAVESLDIWNCGRFRKIVTPTTANFDMRALKDINIRRCGEYYERKNELVKNRQEQELRPLFVDCNFCRFWIYY